MNRFLVDTNVLIRLLVKDDPIKFNTILKLVEKVEKNELTLVIPTVVIAECCWLLKSFYKLDKQRIAAYLLDVILSENVEVEEKYVIQALKTYADKNVDFADALIASKSSSKLAVLTWDKKDFRKLECEYYIPEELI
ncbi:type II toxin-antitoxin system VapC family toxin [Aquibacillus koreensis]|uniref:Type II toxin-antitoxin system VapC family toxin n=1 Tax=Aquibacillus koreensis TaxID=279446 RepID=A0A9X3WL20_9BACI|nr:type II toxin-antitoxin system VapC family toxin [Aquibacillus koreensis]MCT2538264.1 type II toxin-antitoxin system VapC family toxin [Aquibacillus koreensis]MDC3420793.1 type II toxin-antitoxin system VapC family toxin [Aquibacillus koreensis]